MKIDEAQVQYRLRVEERHGERSVIGFSDDAYISLDRYARE